MSNARMPAKRRYTLSDAALQQRRANLSKLKTKRYSVGPLPPMPVLTKHQVDMAIKAVTTIPAELEEAARRMARTRWLNPASEAHKQAARINGRNGGRRPVPTPCVRCKVVCPSAAKAKAHCDFR